MSVGALVGAGTALLARGFGVSSRTGVGSFDVAPIRVLPTAKVALTSSQMQRIAHAADLAEQKGIGRALVVIDGQVLRLDVPTRTITGASGAGETIVEGDCDGVIAVGAERAGSASPAVLLSRLNAGGE